jgi:hypothetical protein
LAQIFPKSANRLPIFLALGGILVPVLATGGIWYYGSPKYTDVGYRPTQPVPYSHKLHVGELGLDCRYCHASVEVSPVANVPPTKACMNCHATVKRDSALLEPIRDSATSGRPMRWVRVHQLPDYAYFEHRSHIRAGVACVTCHGRIDQMEVVTLSQPLSMSWCLDCHRNPAPNLRPPGRGHEHAVDPAQEPGAVGGADDRRAPPRPAHRLLGVSPMSERVYWRSTNPDPEFTDREFLEGASEAPEGISRRTMLQLLGASVSLAGLAGCRKPVEAIVPYVDPPEHVIPGIARRYATTIPMGGQAYGVIVESHEGPAHEDRGEPQAPRNARRLQRLAAGADPRSSTTPDRSQTVLHKGETKKEASKEGKPEMAGAKTWADFVAAWGEIAKAASANGGADLALLIEPFASPTLARLLAQFQAAFPQAKVVVWEPAGEENVPARPVYHLDKAKVIVSLDADLFYSDGNPVVQARQFADGRRLGTPADEMNRLYVIESAYSITGAKADHRFAVPASQMPKIARALQSGAATDLPWVAAVVKDLAAHGGESLVVAGRRWSALEPFVQAINTALGNVGSTVTYHEAKDAVFSSTWDLQKLVEAMQAGTIKTLVVLGGNPVYATPADLALDAALKKVPQTIHVGTHVDETATTCTWHVPQATPSNRGGTAGPRTAPHPSCSR